MRSPAISRTPSDPVILPNDETLAAIQAPAPILGRRDLMQSFKLANLLEAGVSVPLIDQAVVGASGGTFDVVISDAYATDGPLFRSKFPALAKVEVQQEVLPAFDRKKAQEWWETH